MTIDRRIVSAALALVTAGCSSMPSQEEIDDAKARASAAVRAANQARQALELLGILPVYTCGEPRRTFVGRAVEEAQSEIGCVTATASESGETADQVTLAFPEAGCSAGGYMLSGQALYLYSGGEDRLTLDGDFRGIKIDGDPLQAKAGYGTCGDEKSVWALAEGELPNEVGKGFKIDGKVGIRDGMPLIGSTSLLLDGSGEVTVSSGSDRLTLTGLLYEIGEYMPKEGSLLIETAGGTAIKVTFRETLWKLGEAEVVIDDRSPVKVPIVR
jgi:hypothetical protein